MVVLGDGWKVARKKREGGDGRRGGGGMRETERVGGCERKGKVRGGRVARGGGGGDGVREVRWR